MDVPWCPVAAMLWRYEGGLCICHRSCWQLETVWPLLCVCPREEGQRLVYFSCTPYKVRQMLQDQPPAVLVQPHAAATCTLGLSHPRI